MAKRDEKSRQEAARRKPWRYAGAWFYVDKETCSFYVDGGSGGIHIATTKPLYALRRAGLIPVKKAHREGGEG